MGAMSPAILIDALKREKAKRAAEASLIEFARQAWHIIEPGTDYVNNWHLEAVAEHLMAVSAGEIGNLLINIPPGCCKSILTSVLFPAWEWIGDPGLRYLGASYGEDLAVRDAMKCRDIIMSDWYQSNWPHVKIKQGEDQKTKYAITGGGWRMATSVGGRGTGEHPDRKIVDDPHNAKQAQSDAERGSALNWFDQTLASRGVSRGASTIVVMQRLHEEDVSGHILEDLKDHNYTHLCLPMRYESAMRKPPTKLGWEDPRSVEGSLLWPELFPEEKIKKLESSLGEYGTAGQLQQRPAPAGGGILKIKHFQLWPHDKELPQFLYIAQSWDTAYSEKTTGDDSACTVWAAAVHDNAKIAILVDAKAEKMAYPVLKKTVIKDWGVAYGPDRKRADTVLVEKKASGQSLIQDLRVAKIPVATYDPGKADKVVRAHIAAPILEMDVIYVLESKLEPGKPVAWARPFLKQCEGFPSASDDDLVDTFTQTMILFRDMDLIASPEYEPDDLEEDEVDYSKPKRNPYDA